MKPTYLPDQLGALNIRASCRLLGGLLLFFVAGSCSEKEEERQEEISHSPATAQLVSHVTSGVVSSTDLIRVRFAKPTIEENLVAHSLGKKVFRFDPELDGITQWESRNTLLFRPNRPLTLRRHYRGTLDLAALLPQLKENNLEPLQFQFTVAGRELLSVEGEFNLKTDSDPRFLIYSGKIIFTEESNLPTAKKNTRLYLGEESLPLSWQDSNDGKTFTFASPVLERGVQEKKITLSIDKEDLDLSRSYRDQFVLAAQQEMRLLKIEKEEEGEHPRATLHFSDELDTRQDIQGLIGVSAPEGMEVNAQRLAVKMHLQVMGKQVIVDGDFGHGQSYQLEVRPGIRSRWGTRTQDETVETLDFADLKPQLRFGRQGVFLPSTEEKKLRFATLNLQRVHVSAKKVFASNLGQFLQTERLSSARERNRRFSNRYVERVGISIGDQILEIGTSRNTWLEHELDLGQIIDPGEKGVYLIHLNFTQEDMLYGTPEALQAWNATGRRRNRETYFSHPFSPGYLRAHGQIYKAVILSDIGLTYKQAHQRHMVYATRIADARPLEDVIITLRTYQNQVIARKTTDAEGRADFAVEDQVFYVEAEKDGQRSLIKPDEMAWNLSTFDTGGEEVISGGTRAFIYTERGVYRPGDPVNISVIARHADAHSFPDGHPVTCKVFNPRKQLMFEQTRTDARDGFYNFKLTTAPEDPTGNWLVQVLVGATTFDHVLKIETVVPYRLKTRINTARERLGRHDKTLEFDLESTYLFGNPAIGLKAEVDLVLQSRPRTFPHYEAFSFSNEPVEYKSVQAELYRGKLDSKGRTHIAWHLPPLDNAPGTIRAVLQARVFEKGGRPNHRRRELTIDPYDYYIGLQKPQFDYGYARVGAPVSIPAILVDVQGKAVSGRPLHYRIYKGTSHWWWEYENRESFRQRFKSDRHTELIIEDQLVSEATPVELSFQPDERGEYLIEVSDGGQGGHTAAFFMQAHLWGRVPLGTGDGNLLVLKSDKELYEPGDEAVLSFPVPREGTVLLALEKGDQVLLSRWYPLDGEEEEIRLRIPLDVSMAPTVYASISLIQPHSQTDNDRPLRLYGVLPLAVRDLSTLRGFAIDMPDRLQPNQPFEIEVRSERPDSVQFTVAVVDEGLLALTDFATPDPWQGFYQKQRLGVRTYDLFSQVIGVARGDIFKTFSIGGGFAVDRQAQQPQRRRFKALSMFKGPLTTGADGRAKVSFDLPNYVGAVRAMVVGAKGSSYGHAEKTVPVKGDLIILPTLPRVLGPGDRIEVPVTVFAMADSLGDVEVSLQVDGPLVLDGPARQRVHFSGVGERDLYFALRAEMAVGAAQIEIAARAAAAQTLQTVDIQVRASSPKLYESVERQIRPGTQSTFAVPDKGISGTNRARINVRRRPDFNFGNHLLRLVRYPYGCIEQMVSSAFPQLYLKQVLTLEAAERDLVAADIDAHINAAILHLRRFQLPDHSFSYWPGNRSTSVWGSLYAGHFLIEARDLGYYVPDDLLADWLRYQQSQALTTRDALMIRVYRIYLLALAGEAPIGAMNLLVENNLKHMNDTEKWLLAASYLRAGVGQKADAIARAAGALVEDYAEFSGTYGSGLRDKALILDAMVAFARWDAADGLAKELALALSSGQWHSTQTTAVTLLALGKYLNALEDDGVSPLTGHILLPTGERLEFHTEELGYQVQITDGFGGEVQVHLDQDLGIERAFVALDWEGVPLQGPGVDISTHLDLTAKWLDEDGMPIEPDSLGQGTSFWGHFRVANPTYAEAVEEVALEQILPAGWEIENVRLLKTDVPDWMSSLQLNQEDYVDIRDDRIIWFFDLHRKQHLDFVVKLNTVMAGEFTLPPTQVEAMYNKDFRALKAGGKVVVGR